MGMRTRNWTSKSEDDDNNKDTDHTVDGVRRPSSSSSLEKEEEQQGRNTKDDDTAAPDAQTDEDSDCHRDDAPAREVVAAVASLLRLQFRTVLADPPVAAHRRLRRALPPRDWYPSYYD